LRLMVRNRLTSFCVKCLIKVRLLISCCRYIFKRSKLRYIIPYLGGFYDVSKLFFKHVQDIICVAACAPPGGGRNDVSPRLLRHFSMI
jgi:hypothetical protein